LKSVGTAREDSRGVFETFFRSAEARFIPDAYLMDKILDVGLPTGPDSTAKIRTQ
jgi:hypothetical protein